MASVCAEEAIEAIVASSSEVKATDARLPLHTLSRLGIAPFSTVVLTADRKPAPSRIAFVAVPDLQEGGGAGNTTTVTLAAAVLRALDIPEGAAFHLYVPRDAESLPQASALGVASLSSSTASDGLAPKHLVELRRQLRGMMLSAGECVLIEDRGRIRLLQVCAVETDEADSNDSGASKVWEGRVVFGNATTLRVTPPPPISVSEHTSAKADQVSSSHTKSDGGDPGDVQTGGGLKKMLASRLERRTGGRVGYQVEHRLAGAVAGMINLRAIKSRGVRRGVQAASGAEHGVGAGQALVEERREDRDADVSALATGMGGLGIDGAATAGMGDADRKEKEIEFASFGGTGVFVCGPAGSGRSKLLHDLGTCVGELGGKILRIDGAEAVLARRRGERGAAGRVERFLSGLLHGAEGEWSRSEGGGRTEAVESDGTRERGTDRGWALVLVDDLDDMFEMDAEGEQVGGAGAGSELVLALKRWRRETDRLQPSARSNEQDASSPDNGHGAAGGAGGEKPGEEKGLCAQKRGFAWGVIATARAVERVPAWARRSADMQGSVTIKGPGPNERAAMLVGISGDDAGGPLGMGAHGYSIGDLVRHYRTAVLSAQGSPCQGSDADVGQGKEGGRGWVSGWERGKSVVRVARGGGMEEIQPEVTWNELGGFRAEKQILERVVLWPLERQAKFEKLKVRPVGGVLLTGPTGSGKSLLAQSIAAASPCRAVCVQCPLLLKSYLGESERAVRELFAAAREMAPCVLVLDELDAIAMSRSLSSGADQAQSVEGRLLSTLLNEMDGVTGRGGHVTIIGCTADPSQLDAALLRPGRFDEIIELAKPDHEARVEIMRYCLRKTPGAARVDLATLSVMMTLAAFSPAQLASLCSTAALAALEQDSELTTEHVKASMLEHMSRMQRMASATAAPALSVGN